MRGNELLSAPGNPGIEQFAKCFSDISAEDIDGLVSLAEKEKVNLVVVGPEVPLALGLADRLKEKNIPVFGPTKSAAFIEASKAFAKELMIKSGVPTASYKEFTDESSARSFIGTTDGPYVLKADGLAAGKGVVVAKTREEALSSLSRVFSVNGKVIIEEFLKGVEVSFIIATDGERVVPLSTAHDYKRIFDNDEGPNTGGMGTVSPTPRIDISRTNELVKLVISPILKSFRDRGTPFCGFLYAGLMVDGESVKVVEYNCRMGDPEAQSILPRMQIDTAKLFYALATKGELPEVKFSEQVCVSVVLAAPGYPGEVKKGGVIEGIEFASSLKNVLIFHAGTKRNEQGQIVVNGGRVLNVTGFGETLEAARQNAYRAVDMIQFAGRQVRRDIGK
jgi:phosphoribosylamine--glycine ligase